MADVPNIVWITIDSLRMDHTSLDGYSRDTTPRIAKLADEGISFDNCIAPGHATPHSSASFLTGVYPFRHGLGVTNDYLPENLSTVPELLHSIGYETAGLSRNSYVSPGTGLDRGFKRFEWVNSSRFLDVVPNSILLKWILNIRRHSAGFTASAGKHSTPYLVNGIAKKWLSSLKDSTPFFFYLHYNEPHHPYYPPLSHLDEYTDEIEFTAKEAARFSMEMHKNYRKWISNKRSFSEDEIDALEALYDAEVKYTDKMIGQLFDYIQSLELTNTILVITADHGDFFGEKGLLSHLLSIDDAVTRTPLVVHGFDQLQGQSHLVQQIDVMQTLVKELGGDVSQFQGVDLLKSEREYAITNRAPIDKEYWHDLNPDFDVSAYHPDKLASIRSERYRFQKSREKSELYKLPNEEMDVSCEYPQVQETLDTELSQWLESSGIPIESENKSRLNENMRQQLRNLGYVE